MATVFATASDKAYVALEARPAGQRWYAFDVNIGDARKKRARLFVMTIWEDRVLQDEASGTYWYKVPYFEPDGKKKENRTSLCDALRIAWAARLPMTGILKEGAGRKWCSLDHIFKINSVTDCVAESVIWLELVPRNPTDVGCDVNRVVVRHLAHNAISIGKINEDFDALVEVARADRAARLRRLRDAPKIPRRIVTSCLLFDRNPDVVAEVLDRAGNRCGRCGNEAPFVKRSNGRPYLEVHHVVPLAQGGKDSVDNAIAACPNCHREQHYG